MLWGSPHDYLPFFAPTRCMSRGASPRGYQWVPNPTPQPSSAPCTHPQREGQRQGSTQHYYFKAVRSSSCFHPGSKQHLLSLSSWRAAQQQHPVPKAPLLDPYPPPKQAQGWFGALHHLCCSPTASWSDLEANWIKQRLPSPCGQLGR